MQSDQQLLEFNNFIATRPPIVWWELHSSAPGHDRDELFLQFKDGSVLRVFAEHRAHGAALVVEPWSRLPVGRATRNLPTEANNRQFTDSGGL